MCACWLSDTEDMFMLAYFCLYSPRIYLPRKALDEANANNQTPDTLYALSLLEETGICVVPASGFGQKEGRVGFRTTFLPKDEQLFRAISEFKKHHKLFCAKYSK